MQNPPFGVKTEVSSPKDDDGSAYSRLKTPRPDEILGTWENPATWRPFRVSSADDAVESSETNHLSTIRAGGVTVKLQTRVSLRGPRGQQYPAELLDWMKDEDFGETLVEGRLVISKNPETGRMPELHCYSDDRWILTTGDGEFDIVWTNIGRNGEAQFRSRDD